MKNKLLALATVAGLALIAGQASAITTATVGNATITEVTPGEAYFWTAQTDGGPSTASFTVPAGTPQRAQFSWSVLGVPLGSNPTFEFVILNGGGSVVDEAFTLPAFGAGSVIISVGQSLSFGITGVTGNALASGQVTFAPIPLPAGILLLLTALGGLAATRKISKKPEMA
ncbi:MAG: VPLPA-CTERM sorting domain-containing protein [Roseinatronobacter sp.]